MTWMPAKGARVKAKKFGWGTITWLRGNQVGLALDSAMLEIALPISNLETPTGWVESIETLPAAPAETVAPVAQIPTAVADEPRLKRRAIEALRFGIVPPSDLPALTMGYDALRTWTLKCLEKARRGLSSFAEVEGAFGTGKSHTMSVVRHVAQAGGFVTAKIEVDGRGVTLAEPGKLLMHIMQSLEIPAHPSPTPLLDLHLSALYRAKGEADVQLADFERVQANYMTIQSLVREKVMDRWGEAMEAVLSGSDELTASELQRQISADLWKRGVSTWGDECYVHPTRLVGRARADRGEDFAKALSGYARLAVLAGYKGLVLTIDEFEVERVTLTRAKRRDLDDVLDGLTDYLSGPASKIDAPLAVFIATTAEEDVEPLVDYLRERTKGLLHRVEPLSSADRALLASRIGSTYKAAYALEQSVASIATEVEETLDDSDIEGSGFIRAFIKRYVFELDTRHGPPSVATG